MCDLRREKTIDQSFGNPLLGGIVIPEGDPKHEQRGGTQQARHDQGPLPMHSPRPHHHTTFGLGPVSPFC